MSVGDLGIGNIGRGMPAGVEAEVLASGAGVGVVARKIAGRENRGAHGPVAHRSGLAEPLEVADIGEHLHKKKLTGCITNKENENLMHANIV